jgi:3-oxoacid CoA-transferase subunit B
MDEKEADIDIVNAGSQPTVLLPGASIFDLNTSFVMIRGGYLDMAILGAYQVSVKGDLANWQLIGYHVGGIGGAIELAASVKRLIVTMEHIDKNGRPKIVRECSFPVTARSCVDTIITNLAYIEVTSEGLLLKEVAPGITPEDVQAVTEPPLKISKNLIEMDL